MSEGFFGKRTTPPTNFVAITGASVLELVIVVALVFLIVTTFQIVLSQHNERLRDLERLVIIRQAETSFARLFLTTGGYQSAAEGGGCKETGSLLEQCNFSLLERSAAMFKDPGDKKFEITVPPNTTMYEVTFSLELSHGSLPAGQHTLTPQGIR